MESTFSPSEKKDGSPSQESIGHLQSMKRDIESLEDFEDLTKDVPSMKDVTAQFLQFETGERDKTKSNDSYTSQDEYFTMDANNASDFTFNSPSNPGDLESKENPRQLLDTNHRILEPSHEASKKFLDTSDHHDDDSNKLLQFEQTGTQDKKSYDGVIDYFPKEPNMETQPIVNILDENKLVDVVSNDEISTGSEDLSFIPKKLESSPVLHSDFDKDILKKPLPDSWSNETAELPLNLQPLFKFTSELGMTTEQEPEILQGDGLHVKENNEEDTSDNDDFIPEPIPKDYPEIGTVEGKQILAAFGLDTWFHPDLLNPKLESLVYWRDPKKSGIVFGSVLVVLLSLTSFSLISVVAYTSLTALAAALAFRIYKNVLQAVQKTSEGHPFKEYLDIDLTVNPDKAREISDVVVSYVNKTLTELRRLFLVEDVIDSVKFGIALWGLTYVGAWFNGLSLLIIAFVGLFTLPKVYENNKTQVDANIDIVKTKINEATEKIKAVIPVGKKAEEIKNKSE